MNKKIISILLSLTVFLAGCSSSDPDIISYQSDVAKTVNLVEDGQASLFSSKLAVIEEEQLDTSDTEMSSSASILVNRTTGEVVYGKNIFSKQYPASITKIATALMTLKYGNLDETVTVSQAASHVTEPGAKLCGFSEGDTIPMRTILNSMLVYSGNDAAIAIADHLYGSEAEFSENVNQEMKSLGATHTHFVNSNGLDHKDHYTTAYDLYLIFNELLQYDEFKNIIKEDQVRAEYKMADGRQMLQYFANTNQYLTKVTKAPEGVKVIGGKTGTTSNAGHCLILYSTDSKGNEYVSLVLNAASKSDLYKQMNHLLSKIK